MRRIWLVLLALVCPASFASAGPTQAKTITAATVKHSSTNKGTMRQCENGKCHRIAVFSGHNAAKQTLRATPLDRPSGHVKLRAENLAEEVEVDIYKADGSYDEGALAKLDELFRDPKLG